MPQQPMGAGIEAKANQVAKFCQSRFSEYFSGIDIEASIKAGVLVLYRRSNPRMDAALLREFPEVKMTFRDAQYSVLHLRSLKSIILDDRDYWRKRGIDILSVWPKTDGSAVTVVTSSAEASGVSDALHRRYPDWPLEVFSTGRWKPLPYLGPGQIAGQ